MIIKDKLMQIGLTEYEAIVYTCLLERGKATAKMLYSMTGINRVSTYNILESLARKGLISSIDTPKTKIYIAESPNRLIDLIQGKKQELEETKKNLDESQENLKRFLPELELMHKSLSNKPRVRFFEGYDGLKSLQEDILKTSKDAQEPIYEIFSEDQVKKFGILVSSYNSQRRRHVDQIEHENIPGKCIYTSSENEGLPDVLQKPNIEAVFVRSDQYPILADCTIYHDKIALSAIEGGISGVLIENHEMATTLKTLFRLAMERLHDEKSST